MKDLQSNGNGVTAGDLKGKLNRIRQGSEEARKAEPAPRLDDAIDTTVENSDSELDINELLRRYMPEDTPNEEEDEFDLLPEEPLDMPPPPARMDEPVMPDESIQINEPVKKDESHRMDDVSAEDEKLLDALDSAFSLPSEAKPELAAEPLVFSVADARRAGQTETETKPETLFDLYDEELLEESKPAKAGRTGTEEKPEKKPGAVKRFFSWFFAADDEADEEEDETADLEEPVAAGQPDLTRETVPAQPLRAAETVDKADDLFADLGLTESDETDWADLPDETSGSDAAEPGFLSIEEPAAETPAAGEAAAEEAAAPIELAEPSGPDEEEKELPPQVYEAPDIDPTDINLMVAFGMDQDDAEHGKQAKELGDKLQARQESRKKAYKADRPEFVDRSQIPGIRKEFQSKQRSLWIRLGLCALFTILLLIFENIGFLTKIFTGTEKQFAGVLDPAVYPTVYVMVSLQLMLFACLCALEQIYNGLKSLFRGNLRPETLTVLLTLCGILYSAAMSRLATASSEPIAVNLVTALCACLTLIYALFNNRREMMNFEIVSNKRTKHIMRRLTDDEAESELKAFADAEELCDVVRVEKTDFVQGFFRRQQKPDSVTGSFMIVVLSVTVAVSALFTVFAYLKTSSGAYAWQVFYESVLIMAPLSLFLSYAYPFFRANVAARQFDAAIVGEASLEEYSNASVISFNDKNVFPSYSVKVQNIHICNNARIDRVFYYCASVFSYVGGPLQDVFELATQNVERSSRVKVFEAAEGFLSTQVDNVNITFGSREVLRGHGFEINEEEAANDEYFPEELEIMYIFREDKLVAKMYIQYVMDADMDVILKQFAGSGLYGCVRTFDPNISEKMIARKLNMKKVPLRVVRYANTADVTEYEEKVDSGLVTVSSPKSLLQVIPYCNSVLHTKKTNVALSVLSLLIGTAVLVLLFLTGSLGKQHSLFVALYQLVWLVPAYISARVFVR